MAEPELDVEGLMADDGSFDLARLEKVAPKVDQLLGAATQVAIIDAQELVIVAMRPDPGVELS